MIALLLLTVLALLPSPAPAAGAAVDAAAGAPLPRIEIGVGSPASANFQIGAALCHVLNDGARQPGCSLRPVPGSIDSVIETRNGRLDWSVLNAEVLERAWTRQPPFRPDLDAGSLRVVATLAPVYLAIVLRDGLDVPLAGLRGLRVNLGPAGTADRMLAEEVFDGIGTPADTFPMSSGLPPDETVAAYCAGRLDGFVASITVPSPSFSRMLRRCGGHLATLDDALAARWPGPQAAVRLGRIPAEALRPGSAATTVVRSWAVLIATDRTPPQVVYRTLQRLVQSVHALREVSPSLAGLEPSSLALNPTQVPRHAGATQFLKDHRWLP